MKKIVLFSTICFILLFFTKGYCDTLFLLGNNEIYKSTNGGNSWNGLYIDDVTSYNFENFTFDSRNGIVYLSSGNGVYRTSNNGESWKRFDPTGYSEGLKRVFISQDSSSAIYAVSIDALYCSINQGRNWKKLGLPAREAFYMAPFYKSGKIYLAGGCRIYRSGDGGFHWKAIIKGLPKRAVISDLAVNPFNNSELYLATTKGLFHSSDSGATWKNRSISSKNWIVTTKIAYTNQIGLLYAIDEDVKPEGNALLRVSSNGGKTWKAILAKDRIYTFATSPNGKKLYVIYAQTTNMGSVMDPQSRLAITTNSGSTWKYIDNIIPTYGKALQLFSI